MKVLFMGTPDFAVPTLEHIIDAGHEVTLVVTQPDKVKGRGREVVMTPVKECAVKNNIPVFQPVKIKDEESITTLKKYEFDVIVVVAFGQILSKEILDMPRYGCINVHSSLLPAYRGAAPIQWTIIYGEEKTGVSTMYMDEGLDTGDIILQEETPIANDETGGSLHDRLSVMGAKLLIKTLELVKDGNAPRTKQDNSKSNYVGMLDKSMGEMDFEKEAVTLERLIRGLNPWPSAFTFIDGKMLKIWEAKVAALPDISVDKCKPGMVVKVEKEAFYVMTAKDCLKVTSVQLQGKKRMDSGSFLRGFKLSEGVVLGGK